MESKDYKDLEEKEIHKEYKKANKREVDKVVKTQKNIVSSLELEDRVFATTQRQCFASLNIIINTPFYYSSEVSGVEKSAKSERQK